MRYRCLLARQEDILRTDLTVNDPSVLVGMAARAGFISLWCSFSAATLAG
ncbi:hypothetical protein [Streptomyces atratus]|nr:hypothetical protein [Streptomyces atratus]